MYKKSDHRPLRLQVSVVSCFPNQLSDLHSAAVWPLNHKFLTVRWGRAYSYSQAVPKPSWHTEIHVFLEINPAGKNREHRPADLHHRHNQNCRKLLQPLQKAHSYCRRRMTTILTEVRTYVPVSFGSYSPMPHSCKSPRQFEQMHRNLQNAGGIRVFD